MGFLIIGIGSISDTGLNGAILQIISHGFIGAALFFSWPELVMIDYVFFISTKWRNSYPNAKNIYDFHYLIDGFSCIARHERFCCRIESFWGNNYQPKISFSHKNTNNFCNSNWNDINSYLLSILRQMFYAYKFFNTPNSYFFWTARIIYFNFYPYTRNMYWYLFGFHFLIFG